MQVSVPGDASFDLVNRARAAATARLPESREFVDRVLDGAARGYYQNLNSDAQTIDRMRGQGLLIVSSDGVQLDLDAIVSAGSAPPPAPKQVHPFVRHERGVPSAEKGFERFLSECYDVPEFCKQSLLDLARNEFVDVTKCTNPDVYPVQESLSKLCEIGLISVVDAPEVWGKLYCIKWGKIANLPSGPKPRKFIQVEGDESWLEVPANA